MAPGRPDMGDCCNCVDSCGKVDMVGAVLLVMGLGLAGKPGWSVPGSAFPRTLLGWGGDKGCLCIDMLSPP